MGSDNYAPSLESMSAPDVRKPAEFLRECPRDGKHYENQCARCGSSCDFVECENCDEDGFVGHDCGEDCCFCADPEPNVVCDCCGGNGGGWECLSSADWCQANPLPGREDIPRGTIRWFEVFDE